MNVSVSAAALGSFIQTGYKDYRWCSDAETVAFGLVGVGTQVGPPKATWRLQQRSGIA
jgi:hypothetical protein